MARPMTWQKLGRMALASLMALSTPATQGLVLVPLLLYPATSAADEGTTVTPPATTTYDSYLRQDAATTNTGTETTMHVQSRSGSRNRRTVVEFDLTTSGIPTTAAVKTSYLRLFMSSAPSATRTYNAHFITGGTSWTGTTVTWNNRTTGTPWGTAGGDFNATPAASVNTGTTNNVTHTYTILTDGTVANIPQLWISNPAANQGILIKDSVESSATTRIGQYVTQNGATAAQYPQLELRYLRNVTLNAPAVGVSEVTWTWTFPTGSNATNYDGVMFIKKAGSGAAFTFAPADGTAYTVGTNLGNGEGVVGNTSSFATVTVTDENGPDSVVLPNTAYTYRALNHDATNITGAASVTPPHYATGVNANATTAAGGGALKNWSYRSGAATLSPPALDPGNMVLAGSNDNKLHSMSAANGGRNYQPAGAVGITGGAIQSRPVLIPSIVTSVDCDSVTAGQQACDVAYVSSGDGRVYAFNAATGAQLWQSAVLGTGLVGSPSVLVKAFSFPGYPHAFDLVVVGTRNTADTVNNKIYGINGNTGATVWTFAPGNLDIISSTPLIDYFRNQVWVTSRAGASGTQPSLWKLDLTTTNAAGSLLNSVTLSSLAAADRHIDASPEFNLNTNFLFVVTNGGDLVAVDHLNPINVYSLDTGAVSGVGFPVIFQGAGANDDDIYYSTSGGVHKRTFDRVTHAFTNVWNTSVATLGGTPSTPIYFPGPSVTSMYVGVSDGRLKKITLSTGAIALTRTVNLGATVGDPSLDVVTSKLYVGDSSGRIYSFDVF